MSVTYLTLFFSGVFPRFSSFKALNFRSLKTEKGAKLTKKILGFIFRENKEKYFCYGHYIISVTKLLLSQKRLWLFIVVNNNIS